MNFGKVLIFGDSYSTFEGYIPEGYAFYYPPSLSTRPSLPDVNFTWWKALINETASTLILNNSWSGSTMGYTGYNGADTSKTSSFITRLRKLTLEGFFESIEAKAPIERELVKAPVCQKAMSIREAMLMPSAEIDVAEAEGKILSSAAISCPPAIPVVVSGEKITRESIECFRYYGIEKVRVVK